MRRFLQNFVISLSINLILLTPVVGSMYVQAAAPATTPSTTCNAQQALAAQSATTTATTPPASPEGGDIPDIDTSTPNTLTAVNVATAKQNLFFDQATFDAQMKDWAKNDRGYYDPASGTWYFCASEGLSLGFDPAAIDYAGAQYLQTLAYPVNKITYDNQLDAYALTGEPCTLFDPKTNLCDETKTTQPELNPDGTAKVDANGKPIIDSVPKYYTDIWQNGKWDGPKADARILQTLVYLVTPTNQGGAGRELIEVGKILQPGQLDPDFNDPSQVSSHYYDQNNPGNPSIIATGLQISGIDTLRITTKIVQERRLGGSTTTYQYDSIPIKVAYQTDQGVASATNPAANNIMQGAQASFSASLGSLLTSLGLTSTIDFTHANISSIGDVAKLIGTSLIGNLIDSPTQSLQGWDVSSLLNGIGRAYIAQQLGLDANTLANGDTSNDLVRDIGQAKVETTLGLPAGSLSGSNATEIWGSIGRRFLENAINVTPNTLATGTTYSQTDFLQRVGAGYIEQKLGFQPQALQTTDWSKFSSSFKGQLLFNASDAQYLDMELNLAYQQQTGKTTNYYGFTQNDYTDPVGDVVKNHSPSAVGKFLQLAGARAIELSLGKFTLGTSGKSASTPGVTTDPQNIDFVQPVMDAFGITTTISSFASSTAPPIGSVVLLHNKAAGAPGNPNVTVFYSVYMGAQGQSLLKDNFVTQDQLNQLAQWIITARSTNQFTIPQQTNNNGTSSFAATDDQLKALHNALLPWQQLIQTVSTTLSFAVSGGKSLNLSTPMSTLLSIQGMIGNATGTIQQYDDSLTTALNSSGQSGASAALGLPGTFYDVNPDGSYGSAIIQTDPVNAFLKGDVSTDLMQAIGRLIIGTKMSTNITTQNMIAGQVKHDKGGTFSTIPTKASVTTFLGNIDPTVWLKNGLQVADFERIFTKDLAPETFDRIGTQVMLQAAWGKYGTSLLKSSGASNAINQGVQAIDGVIQGFDFYYTRIQDLQNVSKNISAEIEGVTDVPQSLKDQIKALNTGSFKQTIEDIQAISAQYEAVMGQVNFSKLSQTVQTQIAQAIHDMEEIAAGHSLSFNQTAASVNTANTSCFNPLTLRGYLSSGSKSSFSSIAVKVAACKLDTGLGLPIGSIFAWYSSKQYTVDGLELAVGQTYAKQSNSNLTNDAAKAKGKLILESAAIGALVGNIPGIGGDLKKLNLTTTDILNLLTGNTTQIIEKLGGKLIDGYFNWTPGTAEAIINPQCYDPATKKTSTCSSDDATNVRVNALASIGLKQLGVSLNFPNTFNIAGKGDFTTNYGTAQISETLGLAPNSFSGSFANVRSLNNPQDLLVSLGWYPAAPVQDLTKLITALQGDPSLLNALTDTQIARDKINNTLLDSLADANSQIWKIDPTKPIDAATTAYATSLMSSELSVFSDAISVIKTDIAESSHATDSTINNLIASIEISNSTPTPDQVSTMTNQIVSVINRIQGLDIQTGQSSGTFQDFITNADDGSTSASDISKNSGARTLGQILDKKVFNNLLKDTPFANLYATIQQLTKTTACGDGLSIGGLLLGSSAFGDSVDCLSDSISGFSLANMFKGSSSDGLTGTKGEASAEDKKTQLARQQLLVNVASTSWAMKLEKGLDLEPGTLKAIALKPQDAPEIAIDQGLRIIGSQLLGIKPGDMQQDNSIKGIYNSFRASIDAGFCPVDPTSSTITPDELQLIVSNKVNCSLNFNSNRALGVFKSSLVNMLQTSYQSGALPTQFGLADIGLVLAGGTQGIYLEGLAHMAAEANKLLGNSGKAQAFRINFMDIRGAAGLSVLSPQAIATAQSAQEADWVYSNVDPAVYGMSAIDWDTFQSTMTDQQLVDWYINTDDKESTGDDRLLTMAHQGTVGEKNLVSQTQHDAQTRLQYQLYDVAAFKLDPNIPPGFSHAMFEGTKYERTQELGLFLFNTLNSSTHILTDIGLTSQDALALSNFLSACFGSTKKCNSTPLNLAALSKIDTYVGKIIGVTLPQGTTAGLLAWASTGFKSAQFNSTSITLGGQKVPPIGSVLENWGMQKLFTWADKALGFQLGSVYQIYQASQTYINAVKTLQSLMQTVESSTAEGETVFNTLGNSKQIAQANANMATARTQLTALVINIVFKSQISDLEKSLGLVPGTGSVAVGILASLATPPYAVPWAQIAIFIALNLFGVYKVEIYQQATGDGYYPFTGHLGGNRINPLEYPMPEPAVGEFDAKNPVTYKVGLEKAAQNKVESVLQDLLVMPKKWGAATGIDPKSLWISQVYTARQEDLANLDYLIDQPAPWQGLNTYGYGSLTPQRATVSFDNQGNELTNATQYAGYFYDQGCNTSSALISTAPASTASPTATAGAGTASSTTAQCVFGSHIQLSW